MNNYPGPGTYQNKSTLASNHYSIRKMTDTGFLSKLSKYPGPGTYESIQSLPKSGKFFYGKYKTQGVPIILPDREFISPNRINVPGPGSYKPNHHFIDQALDKFKRSKGGRFSKSKKMVRYIDKNPGPGSYESKTMFK